MTFKLLSPQYAGYPAIEAFLPTAAVALAAGIPASRYPPVPPGMIVEADDPVWGSGEFIFAVANGTIPVRALCSLIPVWNSTTRRYDWNATAVPNTAGLGKMVGVCMSEAGSAVNALTAGQFGWFMVTGLSPVNGTATVAADTAFGITAAGQVGAMTAGKQIVNARVVTPATQTVVIASNTGADGGASGSFQIALANCDGVFVGAYASGTGVGAAAIVSAIDRQQCVVTVSVANSAAVSGNVTFTYNNATIFYNVAQLNRAFAQGQIA
jgi:hypothetical protein